MIRLSVIYKHTCLTCTFCNGIYIGQVKEDLITKRWNSGKGYLVKKPNGKYAQAKMAKAILEAGLENWNNPNIWKHEILFSGLDAEEADKLEKQLIEQYDSFTNGLNGTLGGNDCITKYKTFEESYQASLARARVYSANYKKAHKAEIIKKNNEKRKTNEKIRLSSLQSSKKVRTQIKAIRDFIVKNYDITLLSEETKQQLHNVKRCNLTWLKSLYKELFNKEWE